MKLTHATHLCHLCKTFRAFTLIINQYFVLLQASIEKHHCCEICISLDVHLRNVLISLSHSISLFDKCAYIFSSCSISFSVACSCQLMIQTPFDNPGPRHIPKAGHSRMMFFLDEFEVLHWPTVTSKVRYVYITHLFHTPSPPTLLSLSHAIKIFTHTLDDTHKKTYTNTLFLKTNIKRHPLSLSIPYTHTL